MTDEDVLCDFVIWHLRQRDLPDDVAAAAERLCHRFPRDPSLLPHPGYLEAQFSVSGVWMAEDRYTGDVSDWARAFDRHDALDKADQLLSDGADYVLVQRDTRS